MNRYTLDRFEGGFAILIDGEANAETIPRSVIPENAAEGDTLVFEGERWAVDRKQTKARKASIQSRFDRLKKRTWSSDYMRGKFIVFEGIDGSGKTTQLLALCERLKERGITVLCDKEPTDSVIGRIVRAALRKQLTLHEETLALLFAADRLEHISELKPALENGTTVLCDRYVFSSLAYQSVTLPLERVLEYNSTAIGALMPDLTVFFDVSPETCARRINENRSAPELFENPERALIVRENYFKVFDKLGDKTKTVIIDGNSEFNDISASVLNAVKPLFSL